MRLKRNKNIYYLTAYDTEIKRLISAFKLRNRRYIGELLGGFIKDPLERVIDEEEIDLVIPVPVSRDRKRSRGYNQVEDILTCAGIGFERVMRIRDTKPMHSLLDEKLRKENVSGSFKSQVDIANKNILIVDDIVTTGSTVRELIRALEAQGKARKIIVFTFALAKTAFVNDLTFERE